MFDEETRRGQSGERLDRQWLKLPDCRSKGDGSWYGVGARGYLGAEDISVRRYLYIEQLAACTPWSADAIRTMIARGTFKLGVHYFKPHGPNGRPIFSWEAIVRYIEGGGGESLSADAIPLPDGTVIDLNEATAKAHRLRD